MNKNLLHKIPKEYFIQGKSFNIKNPVTFKGAGFI